MELMSEKQTVRAVLAVDKQMVRLTPNDVNAKEPWSVPGRVRLVSVEPGETKLWAPAAGNRGEAVVE